MPRLPSYGQKENDVTPHHAQVGAHLLQCQLNSFMAMKGVDRQSRAGALKK